MLPYKRVHKPIRHNPNFHSGKWFGRIGKAIGSLWKDIQIIWFREPPFPASVRIIISLILTWMLIMPFLYILIPSMLTLVTVYVLSCDEFPNFMILPKLHPAQQKFAFKAFKDMCKKATFRLSMFVTLYDYVQTFRAIGGFNGLNLQY